MIDFCIDLEGDFYWFFLDLGAKQHMANLKKPLKTSGFSMFLEVLGVLLEVMLAHLGAMLGYVGQARRHFRATWRQDEAQERQDELRLRKMTHKSAKTKQDRRT